MEPLVAAWQNGIDSFQRTVGQIPDGDLPRPSRLPGWTIGDIIAHVAALELELGGEPLPAHEPDWDALPHADDMFSRYTEIGVDHRRGWSPEDLRADLARAAAIRTEQLTAEPLDLSSRVKGVGGMERSLKQVLRMRCFDIFLHEIDIRDALGMSEPQLGAAARVTAELIADGLGFVWVKRAGAEPGDVLHLVVADWLDAWIGVGEDGRGRMIEPGGATTTLALAPLDFLRLGSGRGGDVAAAGVGGDLERGQKVLAGLNVSP